MAFPCGASWFAGKITREQGMGILAKTQACSFLLRQSTTVQDKFYLMANDGGVVVSFNIEFHKTEGTFLFANQRYNSLEELVGFLAKKAFPSKQPGKHLRFLYPVKCREAGSQPQRQQIRPNSLKTGKPTDADKAALLAAARPGQPHTATSRNPSQQSSQKQRDTKGGSGKKIPSSAGKSPIKRAPSAQEKQALLAAVTGNPVRGDSKPTPSSEPPRRKTMEHVLVPDDIDKDEAYLTSEAIYANSKLLSSDNSNTSTPLAKKEATHKSLEIFISPLDLKAYEKLDVHATFPDQLPDCFKGKTKNRYFDILPNPITRVKLKMLRPPPGREVDPGSCYINANFVRGYGGKTAREYIAAQAPMPSTLYNFVRMIWEERVNCIVMTTGLLEGGKRKCERYWPETPRSPPLCFNPIDGSRGAEIMISLVKTEQLPGTKIHHIQIKDRKSGETRNIRHFWYYAWPDHGVPNKKGEVYPDDVVELLEAVALYRKSAPRTPMLVHCSAGVGRTGTFIVIDHVMKAIQNQDQVDIIELISQLREDRMLLIQHTSQYKFAYQACIQYARKHVADIKGGSIYAIASPYASVKEGKVNDTITRESWKPSDFRGVSVFELVDNPVKIKLTEEEASEEVEKDADTLTSLETEKGRSGMEEIPVMKQPWFRHAFSREQVQEMLADAVPGTFVVRSSVQKKMFVLSVRSPSGGVVHVRLIPIVDNGGTTRYKLGNKGERVFDSILDLVKSFSQDDELVDQKSGVKFNLLLDGGDKAAAQPGEVLYESFVLPDDDDDEDDGAENLYKSIKKVKEPVLVPELYDQANKSNDNASVPPVPPKAQAAKITKQEEIAPILPIPAYADASKENREKNSLQSGGDSEDSDDNFLEV
eukprot:m.48238 g.48238  ORF g.48238 m.48238 type:complete len:874 (-) comp10559_c0_seq1:46-2667(-)